MSTSPDHGRKLWLNVFRNFLKSFGILKAELKSVCVGKDLYGNKFYESQPGSQSHHRKTRRYFEPDKDMHFDVNNMSSEWDAWLRHKRKVPPSIEELTKNVQLAQIAKENFDKMNTKIIDKNTAEEKHASMTQFPVYKDLEVNPGKDSTKFEDESKDKNQTK